MKRTIVVLIGVIGLLLVCLTRCNNEPTVLRGSIVTPPMSLPQKVAKRVIVDTAKRRLIVQEPRVSPGATGSTSVNQQSIFLPPHAQIDVLKNGDINIIAKPFGVAISPFIGGGAAERDRLYAGAHLVYFKYFDFGPFMSFDKTNLPRFGVEASWNVWRSVDVGIGYDNHQKANLLLTVKL